MNAQIKRVGLIILGWFFILLGIAGLFLPFLQGILFILIGLLILSTEYIWAHKLLNKFRSMFPRFSHLLDVAEERAKGWLHRFGRRRHAPKCADSED